MNKTNFELRLTPPSLMEFEKLRALVAWRNVESHLTQKSIDASLFWVCAYRDQQLIGTGRVIGDGAMYFYIQDVIVDPQFQGLGLGTAIMCNIEDYLQDVCVAGATIGLMAAKGKEGFYSRFGYTERDGSELGLGMCRFV